MHEHPRDAIERPPIAVSGSKDVGAREPECLNNFHNILFERQHMIISGAEAARSAASTGKQLCGIMRTHLPAAGSMVFLSACPSEAHPTPRTCPQATPQACPEFQQSTSIPVSETTTRKNSMHNAELVETLTHDGTNSSRLSKHLLTNASCQRQSMMENPFQGWSLPTQVIKPWQATAATIRDATQPMHHEFETVGIESQAPGVSHTHLTPRATRVAYDAVMRTVIWRFCHIRGS